MKKIHSFLLIVLFSACTSEAQYAESRDNDTFSEADNPKKPKMQVVFALDATGSMGGLISTAKEKIWSIVSSLMQTQTSPHIEIGLVFYRDRGDAFVTKRVALSDSIDMVYSELMQVQAQGGGDGPESVNQGLNEAVESFSWDQDTSTYKAVFLVGDFEPHMNYKNDVPYFETCKIARIKDITLNTILMGNNRVAEKVWKEIAACNEGAFVNVNMNANDIVIQTPYDATIAAIGDQLDDLRYYYGRTEVRIYNNDYKVKGKRVAAGSNDAVKAQRAEYNSLYLKSKIHHKQNELLGDLASGTVKLDSMRQADLPDEFKHLSKDSIVIVVQQKIALRDDLQKKLQAEIVKRNEYIQTTLAKKNKAEVENSFNYIIYENIKKQTRKKKIVLQGKSKF